MKNKPKVSVVVPIYNVEKYLHECVDSILAQTLPDIEVILVDDGSPDGCPQIVDEYAAKDPRVVAIHQPNSGYGVAVNNGVSAATGEFIGIVESDDFIVPKMYEKLYNNAVCNDSDVVKCSFYVYNPAYRSKKHINEPWDVKYMDLFDAPQGSFTIAEYPPIVMFHSSVWASLYRADFLKNNSIKMLETRSASYQDFPFMCEVMSKAKRISVESDYLLHYRIFAENNSTQQKSERLIMMATQCINGINILQQNNILNFCREEIYFHSYIANERFFERISCKFKRQYFDELHRLFAPLANDKTFTFKYFHKKMQPLAKAIIAGEYRKALRLLYLSAIKRELKVIRKTIFSVRTQKQLRIIIAGLQIARKGDLSHDIPSWKQIEIGWK
ncbi:MAG: glycosyltransferase [Heliobacteriaceae bacterium]|jgi:glycosyltransferase involved in cell wall biosynthesis|nr:glycosyltransferase [Heliobacteriaceae bacterium]